MVKENILFCFQVIVFLELIEHNWFQSQSKKFKKEFSFQIEKLSKPIKKPIMFYLNKRNPQNQHKMSKIPWLR